MNTSYFTFNPSHSHVINDKLIDKDCVVALTSDTVAPRDLALVLFQTQFSLEFAPVKSESLFKHFSRGIIHLEPNPLSIYLKQLSPIEGEFELHFSTNNSSTLTITFAMDDEEPETRHSPAFGALLTGIESMELKLSHTTVTLDTFPFEEAILEFANANWDFTPPRNYDPLNP